MAIREEFAKSQPLKGARITGSLHMTIQTAVLIETRPRSAPKSAGSCNIFSTQDHAAAAIAAQTSRSSPSRRNPGRLLDYTHRIFEWADGGYSNMILDDGGDATLLLHLGARAEQDIRLSPSGFRRRNHPLRCHQGKLAIDPTWYSVRLAAIKGVTEETTTGVHRLYQMHQRGELKFRASTSMIPSPSPVRQPVRLPRIAGRRHQARHRRDDCRQGRPHRRLRRRGQGLRPGHARPVGASLGHRNRPHLCPASAMEGFRVVTTEYAADKADIFVTTTATSTSSPMTTWRR